ncbi:PrgI family protein [Patescibacteria group bacterium]|nr:PrgI family protein [Patescibacteria group bacterium]
MEQHPIPQDVTGFQFKLIGTMTVKQFGYVAVGAILAVICWYAPSPGLWLILVKFILLPVFGLTGVIIAFVPIEGRPVDVMATHFVHALISPNQYVYIKRGRRFSFTQTTYTKITPVSPNAQRTGAQPKTNIENKKEQQLRTLLSGRYNNIKNNLDKKEMAFLKTIENATIPIPIIVPVMHTPVSNPPSTPAARSQSLVRQEELLQQQLAIARQENSNQKMLLLQSQIQDIHSQKGQVEQELLKLRTQLSAQKPQTSPMPHTDVAHVRNIPQNMIKSAGFSHVSDTPNIIIGIIKDARNNILPNILVEVKNKDGNPVRAFKANPLGQFASATPLANGVYTIELEDPKKQHAFDVIQINANGQIMLPIEIISHDAREELRKALFN